MKAFQEIASQFVNRHWRPLCIVTVVWTAFSGFAFKELWSLYEPYSLYFYLEGRGSVTDMEFDEVKMYVRFFVFIATMTLSTTLPLATMLHLRYFKTKGRV